MLQVRDACRSYGEAEVLHGVSLSVAPGEVVALAGRNGSGKSTLARLACAAELAEVGVVMVDGIDPASGEAGRREARRLVGLVRQDPVDQLVSTLVGDEVAFGPRNLGLDEDEVGRRVHAALAAVGLFGTRARDVNLLSGGEQQRVALAGVLAMHPRYLVLDEVTSMLDSGLRGGVRGLIERLAREEGVGVLSVTHDPIELARADRVVVLEGGRVAWMGAPAALAGAEAGTPEGCLWRDLAGKGPLARAVAARMRGEGTAAPSLRGNATGVPDEQAADEVPAPAWADAASADSAPAAGGRPVSGEPFSLPATAMPDALELTRVSYAYPGASAPAVRDVDLVLRRGEVLLVAGRSGSGKSTIARLAAGLYAPSAGSVELCGHAVAPGDVGLAFQRPESQFFQDTVADEVAYAPRERGLPEGRVEGAVREACRRAGVPEGFLDRHPLELSGGWQRRVGLAGVLALDAPVYVLDEPTAGLDASGRTELHTLVRSLAREGVAVAVISHDMDEWLVEADRVALVSTGRIAWQGEPAALAGDPALWERVGLAAPWVARGGDPLAVDDGGADADASERLDAADPQPARTLYAGRFPSTPDRTRAAAPPRAPLDARVKVLLVLAAIVAAFVAGSPAALAVGYIALIGVMAASRMRPRALARTVRPVAVVLALTLLANLVSCDGHAAMPLAGPVGLDPAAGARAGMAVLRIVLLLGFSLAVAETTGPSELGDAVVRLMRPLDRLGVPTGDAGMALAIALRFIPQVMGEYDRIRLAQRARGAHLDEGPAVERVRAHAAVMVPLVSGLFRRADVLADAMSSRCYGEGAVQVPPRRLAARDAAVLILGLALCLALACLPA